MRGQTRIHYFLFFALSFPILAAFGKDQDYNKQPVLFVSDTQQPIWVETLRLQEHANEIATQHIYDAIERESTAAAIFHLGDITSIGMFESYWKPFDDFQSTVPAPIYPVMGNHDYFFFRDAAMEQFRKRFPALRSSWYSAIIQSVAVIALNSNFSELTDDERIQQQTWYRQQLLRFDYDPKVNAIIVVCHHSPFTNSTIVHPSEGVQKHFLPLFFAARKTAAFISGHAHSYEHFQINGKDFLVIGGGGGLLHPLLTHSAQRYQDLFSRESSMRFFHYLQCDIGSQSLLFSIHKLKQNFSGFEVIDSIRIRYTKP